MMYEYRTKVLSEHITQITDPTGVFCFLVQGKEKAVLIDTGIGIKGLKETVEGLTKLPVEVILTHGHGDHAGGAADFEKVYLHPTDKELLKEHGMEMRMGYMGYFDEAGRLYLTGRLKEMIIRGGENIAPMEIEQVIRKDTRVAQVKVIGVPDEHYGEEVCACIEMQSMQAGTVSRGTLGNSGNEPLTIQKIQQLVAEELAAYKVPRYVLFLKELPLTGNGKIDVAALKKTAAEIVAERKKKELGP